MKLSLRDASIICAVVALCCYVNTLDCGLCYDDTPAIIENGDLRQSTPWSSLLRNDFWGSPVHSNSSHKSYRPLCVATFRLNYLLHELQPMGYHLVNVLLHSAVCYLYVQLCGVVFSEVWPALIAGLLFAVHPIHTEAVAAITGRADVLSGLFFIAALLCYRKGATPNGTEWKWLSLSMLLCLCATLSKETGFTALAVCIVLDYFVVNKMDIFSSLKMFCSETQLPKWFSSFLWRTLSVSVFASVVLAVRLALNQGLPNFTIHDNPPTTFPSPYRQLQWLHLCFVNAWLLFNPSSLSCDWRMGAVTRITSLLNAQNMATFATLAGICTLSVFALSGSLTQSYNCLSERHSFTTKERRPIILAIAIVIFSYLPASNLLLPVGFYVAERILYVPSMGFCMLIAYGFWQILQSLKSKQTKALMVLAIGYLLMAHSTKTLLRNRDWFSSVRLYSSSISTFPRNAHMFNNLGVEYNNIFGNYSKAEAIFRVAIDLGPEVTKPHLALGKLLNGQHRYDEAEEVLQRAAVLAPTDSIAKLRAEIYYELGKLLVRHDPADTNRLQDALKYYTAAHQLFPDETKFLHGQGHTLYKLSRHSEAKRTLEGVLKMDPTHPGANYALGETMLGMGELTQAEYYFRRVLALNCSQSYAKFHLAALLVRVNASRARIMEAEELLLDLLDIEPDNENIVFALGVVYGNLDNHENRAMEMFKKTLEINKMHINALYNLGLMNVKLKNFTNAIEHLTKVLQIAPDHANSMSQLAGCYLKLGLYDRAIELYESVLETNPNHLLTLINLGSLLSELGQVKGAEEVLSRAAELSPSNTDVLNQLATARERRASNLI